MEVKMVAKKQHEPEQEVARIGVYVCHCGLNIAKTVDCEQVAAFSANLENVTISKDIGYACSEPGQQQIKDDILEHNLDLKEDTIPLTKRTLVIGGGVAGIQSALDLADNGYDVVLVEKRPTIGGMMAQLDKTFPTMDCSI